jgi:DNA gyrase/topoisomerase IV subunit B
MCLSRAFASIGTVSEITVKVTNGTEVLIIDNGPGLSMKKDRPDKTLIEILMTELHACKNLKHESIKDFCDSGIVVVNALCSYFYVTNTVDHLANSIWYKKGELELPPFVNHIANTDGLSFKFKFDPEIFGDLKIDKQDLIAEIEKIKATTPAKITLEFDN